MLKKSTTSKKHKVDVIKLFLDRLMVGLIPLLIPLVQS